MADLRRVVLFGKSGSGKSSVANTLFGSSLFAVNHSSDSKSRFSTSQTKMVNELTLTLIDTPGIFNADRTKEEVRCEIYSFLTECAPGPHAFLFVLLVEKFTEQEQAIADQMEQVFGADVFRYTTVVFTHGDQLQEGTEIMEFVNQSKALRELIQKCGGRCHVIDNKYWKNSQDSYRSNSVQVNQIIKSIEDTVRENDGKFFTNEKLKRVENAITEEQMKIHKSEGLSLAESRELAKAKVLKKFIRNQKLKRYAIYALTGLSFTIMIVMGYKIISPHIRRALSDASVVDEAPPSVVEMLQDGVKPIKNKIDYVFELLAAIFGKSTQTTLPNKTHTDF